MYSSIDTNDLDKPNNKCISPSSTHSPFNFPNSPKKINADFINKTTNLNLLKKLEKDYDNFIEKHFQIMMLLDNVDEILEIRDLLLLRINYLRRQEKYYQTRNDDGELIKI